MQAEIVLMFLECSGDLLCIIGGKLRSIAPFSSGITLREGQYGPVTGDNIRRCLGVLNLDAGDSKKRFIGKFSQSLG
jgi:hypothetical protein